MHSTRMICYFDNDLHTSNSSDPTVLIEATVSLEILATQLAEF